MPPREKLLKSSFRINPIVTALVLSRNAHTKSILPHVHERKKAKNWATIVFDLFKEIYIIIIVKTVNNFANSAYYYFRQSSQLFRLFHR